MKIVLYWFLTQKSENFPFFRVLAGRWKIPKAKPIVSQTLECGLPQKYPTYWPRLVPASIRKVVYWAYHKSEWTEMTSCRQIYLSWMHAVKNSANWQWGLNQNCWSQRCIWETRWKCVGSKWNPAWPKLKRLQSCLLYEPCHEKTCLSDQVRLKLACSTTE